jgi:hypothetical protein
MQRSGVGQALTAAPFRPSQPGCASPTRSRSRSSSTAVCSTSPISQTTTSRRIRTDATTTRADRRYATAASPGRGELAAPLLGPALAVRPSRRPRLRTHRRLLGRASDGAVRLLAPAGPALGKRLAERRSPSLSSSLAVAGELTAAVAHERKLDGGRASLSQRRGRAVARAPSRRRRPSGAPAISGGERPASSANQVRRDRRQELRLPRKGGS